MLGGGKIKWRTWDSEFPFRVNAYICHLSGHGSAPNNCKPHTAYSRSKKTLCIRSRVMHGYDNRV
jgi:hypothetical protein